MEFLKTVIKNDEGVLADDGLPSDVTGFIDTGSYALNGLLSGKLEQGGIPDNKVAVLAGDPQTGKTFFTWGLMKNFLINPEDAVYAWETEYAWTKEAMKARGLDTSRIGFKNIDTVEELQTGSVKVLDSYGEARAKGHTGRLMLVCDSLGNLSTRKEMEDVVTESEKKDMTRPGGFKKLFRVTVGRMGKYNVPLIGTNHIYANIGGYGDPRTMGGGSGIIYLASSIILLSKSKYKESDEVVGNIITCTVRKSRWTKEYKKVETLLTFDRGLDRYYGLLDLAVNHGIWKKVSKQIELPDGTKVFESKINNEPKKYYTKDIMARLEVAAAKEFLFGSTTFAEAEAELEKDKKAFEDMVKQNG